MILYFADRKMNIIGAASTNLPKGLTVYDDYKKEDIETGVASFECRIPYDKATRKEVESMAKVGNYILRSNGEENEFYTIIESEGNTRDKEVYVYAEDAGLDLLNEVVGDFEATEAQPIAWYIDQFAYDSGFEIGLNEVPNLTRKLSWEGEETVTSRLASVATQFDGCEISYSFKVDGLEVTNKYINIHKERGKDAGVQLRLNKEVDRIITKENIANLATALICTGGMSNQEHLILETTSNGVLYKVELSTASRTINTAKMNASISAALTSSGAELGEQYGLKASIYMGGSWHSVVIKATDKDNKQKWSGTTSHSTEFTFDISGVIPGVAKYTDIRFKVERTDSAGGTQGVLSSTSCKAYTIPNYIKGGDNGEGIEDRAITLEGYQYDDNDFYIDGNVLKSRSAVQKWGRYVWNKEPNKLANGEGHITRLYEYDTFDQKELLTRSIEELKKAREIEVNYEVDIHRLPKGVKIGDRVTIIDDDVELYVSARILMLETSVANVEQTATIGEYIIKEEGIAEKVERMAQEFTELAKNRTLYTWIAYADDKFGNGISLDATKKLYLGTAVNRPTKTVDLTKPSIFSWVLIKGLDGYSQHLHIKYSNDGGNTFTDNDGETPGDWMGQYTDFVETDSTNVSDYKWTKVKGEDGEAGKDGEDGKAGEDATTLRIDSSRGTVFKNNTVSTVLSAVIYKGSKRITDITALRAEYGAGAYLEWSWQRMGENSFGTIVATDSRIGNDGFTFTLTPEDVDTKVVFMCQLITD